MANKQIKGITIEIGGDTSKLGDALKKSEEASKKAVSELREIDTSLKKNADSAVLWKQKEDILNEALKESREKVKLLEEAQEQVKKQFEKGTIDNEQYRAFERELENARSTAKTLEEQLGDTEAKVKELGDKADSTGDDVKDLGDEAKTAGEKAEKSGNVGMMALATGIAAVSAAAVEAIKSADEMEQSYDTIAKKTGATGEELNKFKENANAVYTSIPTDMDKAATAVGEVNTRFKLTGTELETLSAKFIKFSEINDADLNGSIGTTHKIMQQWQLDIADVDGLLGMITKKAQDTGISADCLMKSVQNNGDTFKEMGLGLDETINLLAQFEENGVNADTAIAGMRKGIKEATEGGKTLGEALEDTIANIKNAKDDTEALSAALELFGNKGADEMANAIREGRMDLTGLSDDMTKYKNVVSDTYEATLSPSEKMKTTSNEVKLTVAKLGTELTKALLPTAEKYLPKLESGTEWLVKNLPKLVNDGKKLLPIITGIGGAVGAWKIVDKVGDGVGVVKNLSEAFKKTSENGGLAAGSIAGIAAALVVGTASYIAAAKRAKEEKAEEIFRQATEESHNLSTWIEDNSSKLKDLKDKTAEAAAEDDNYTKKVQGLWEELQTLVDKNGNVKEGYEDRVNYIKNELSEATGVEIDLVDGQIQKYDELKNTIEETIKKQQAQRLSSIYGEMYVENQNQMDDAVKQLAEAERIKQSTIDDINKYTSQYLGIRINSADELLDVIKANPYNTNKDIDWETLAGSKDELWKQLYNLAYDASQKSWLNDFEKQDILQGFTTALGEKFDAISYNLSSSSNSASEVKKQFAENKYDVENYEKAEVALANGNYEEAIKFYKKIGNADAAAIKDSTKRRDEQLEAMKKAVDNAMREYKARLELGCNDAESTFETSLRNIFEDCKDAGISSGDILSSGIKDQLAGIDGFDTSKLEDFVTGKSSSIGSLISLAFKDGVVKSLDEFTASINTAIDGKFGTSGLTSGIGKQLKGFFGKIDWAAADGGFFSSGRGIVAEAGPELVEVMNAGVRVTPLTSSERNTSVETSPKEPLKIVNVHNTVNANISSKYDVMELAEDLAAAERKVEGGKGN